MLAGDHPISSSAVLTLREQVRALQRTTTWRNGSTHVEVNVTIAHLNYGHRADIVLQCFLIMRLSPQKHIMLHKYLSPSQGIGNALLFALSFHTFPSEYQ